MRNIIGTTLMYVQMVIDLPMWFVSPLLAMITYWCSTHWAGSNVIWTLGTVRWLGVTGIFAIAAVVKPVLWYFDRLDNEFYAATR